MNTFAPPRLGEVRLRGASRARLGQIDWTPIEAEAWLTSVSAALEKHPDCSNAFLGRAQQIVGALRGGSVQYDDLIPITDEELTLKGQIDACLAARAEEAQASAERMDVLTTVGVIGGLGGALALGYWLLS